MSDTPLLPTFITDFVSNASSEQRRALISLLGQYEDCVGPYLTADEDSCSDAEAEPSHPISAISKSTNQISQHVVHVKQLSMSSDLSEGVLNELPSMKLRIKGKNGQTAKVKTQWLITSDKSLNDIKNPKEISNYQCISKVLEIVNNHCSTSGDMNACFVSCMSTKNSSLSYHSDHENMIDQNSDICTVSFGAARTLDFINKDCNHSGGKWTPPQPEFSVPATNHSMNVMKAGCQSFILHRIPPGKAGGVRYSLSFRRVLSQPANINPDPPSTSCRSPNGTTNVVATPAERKKKIMLLAGDSYFERLDMEKLGKGKQSVFKIAKGLQFCNP